MKKIIIHISCLLLLAGAFSSCKKKLEDKYNNPELSTSPSIPGFFTSMLNNDRVRPAYWNQRTFFFPQVSVYAQTTSFVNGSTAYQPIDAYIGNFWSDFYYPAGNGSGVMGLYRSMQKTDSALSAADKAAQEVYMQAAKVVLYDQASRMVDLWGDIPFSEAGSLESKSTIQNPNFDDAKTLYSSFISGLNDAATYFSSAQLAGNTQAAFSKADIMLKGSLSKWQRYANSIRLRLLMRMSFFDETTAKTAVLAMLGNSTAYPLIDGSGVGTYDPSATDVLLQPLTTNTNSMYSALTEIDSYFAPDYMLNTVMLPSNDPRIPVMFDKFGKTVSGVFVQNPTYQAMPITFTAQQQSDNYASYSIVDSTTFLNNIKVPGIAITAPEVNFLKAEAYERWGSSTDAQTAYNLAVTQSVYFYLYINHVGGGTDVAPSSATMTTFLSAPTVAYTGTTAQKQVLIWTQKWLNYGLLQSDQAWSEYRRTKYPQLTFVPQTLNGYQLPPNRLMYPSVETVYNTNYSKVAGKDLLTNKIFWDVK